MVKLHAEAPEWLLERVIAKPEAVPASRPRRREGSLTALDSGAPISEGRRNNTIASILGRKHDGTKSYDELLLEGLSINASRCIPPLPEAEVRRIAMSIWNREPCSASPPDTETLKALAAFEDAILIQDWGRRKSDLSLSKVLLQEAQTRGSLLPCGAVLVNLSYRQLAEKGNVGLKTVERFAKRIKLTGLIRQDNYERTGPDAGAWVLIPPARSDDTTTTVGAGWWGVVTSRFRYSAPRLRASERYIRRLGKSAEAAFDVLEAAGGFLTWAELAAALNLKRVWDLRRSGGWLERAAKAGIIECSGAGVGLTVDWLPSLERRREVTGEIACEVREREKNARCRLDYIDRLAGKAVKRPPSEAELEARALLETLRKQSQERSRFRREQREFMQRPRASKPMLARDYDGYIDELLPADERQVRENASARRRAAIEEAIARLFAECPEYRERRVGQITCRLPWYLALDFPRGSDGMPKDAEVEEILCGVAA